MHLGSTVRRHTVQVYSPSFDSPGFNTTPLHLHLQISPPLFISSTPSPPSASFHCPSGLSLERTSDGLAKLGHGATVHSTRLGSWGNGERTTRAGRKCSAVSELYKIVYCIMYDERMRTWTRRVTNQPRIVHDRDDLTADNSQQEKRTMRTRPDTALLPSHLVEMLPLNSYSISTGNVCPDGT